MNDVRIPLNAPGFIGGSIAITTSRLEALFDRAPRLGFRHIRDAVGGMFGSHRREWLTRTKVNMAKTRGMRVEQLNSRDAGASARFGTFFYRVFPKEKRVPPGQRADLSEIRAETYTYSRPALGLETGGRFTARTGRWLAIPIGVTLDATGRVKARWATPTQFARASARNQLVSLKIGTKYPVLYQVKGGGSRVAGAQAGAFTLLADRPGGRRRTARRVLVPAYQLVPQVNRRPLLRFMATWESLEADRDRRLGVAADRIVEDIERGKSS